MNRTAKLYKQLGDWFMAYPEALLPKSGMPYSDEQVYDYLSFFDPDASIPLDGFTLQGEANEALAEALNDAVTCQLNDLPLIVAIQAGIRGEQLAEIARHHSVNVSSLISTLQAMDEYDYVMKDNSGAILSFPELYIECVKAVSEACPEKLSEQLRVSNYDDYLYIACLHTENPEFWPCTRIAEHMRKMEQGTLPPAAREFVREYNFNGSTSYNDFLPKDPTGIRYDLFLERSGMLLPEVARKKIGNIQQWEDMLASARAGLKIMSGLLDYCIHDAPQHLRPAIFTALSGVSLAGADYDAYGMYYFFEKRVCGTWLESIANNPQFIISFFKDDYQPQALHKALFPNSRWKGDLEQLEFSQAHEIFQNWLDAMVKVPIEEIGASQFNIHSLKQFSMPEIVFSEGFKPEPVILHLLKGFESFSLPDKGGAQRDTRLDEWANESCVYVVKTLASRFELDCKAFADLGSNSIRILAEAGLDKRHLPRMNARDRGLLVSQELGL